MKILNFGSLNVDYIAVDIKDSLRYASAAAACSIPSIEEVLDFVARFEGKQ